MTSRRRLSSGGPSSPADRISLNIFREGKETESGYLTNWQRLCRERVTVSVAAHGPTTPFELVESAAMAKRFDLKEQRRGRGKAFDQYWCIFDVDEHPKMLEALDMAKANAINIALSSPCLELWFLIHFENQTAYLDRNEAQRRSKVLLGCEKVLTPAALALLVENYEKAKAHAQALEAKHVGDGTAQPWNPYSTVWRLVDEIRREAA